MSMVDGGLPNIDFSNIDLSALNVNTVEQAQAAGTVVPGTGTATVQTGPSQDALDILERALRNYGLGDLARRVWDLTQTGAIVNPADPDEVGRALSNTPEYAARFPANVARLKAGLPQLDVTTYIGLERAYASEMRGAGLPAGFYDDPTDFQRLIEGDVSPAEVQTRINEGYRAVSEANPGVIAQMKELYGVDEGGLAAYFIDPDRATPILQRQARAARIASEGLRQAGIQLTADVSETLAREGITGEEAATKFRQVSEQRGLATPMMAGEEAISEAEQIGAVFGTNEAARQRVATRQRRRRAEFEGGGGFAAGQSGISGLRTAGE